MRRLLLLLGLVGCGSVDRDGRGERRTMVVAYGADEFPLTLNRERLGRYPLNAGICESLVRLTDDFAVLPALATRWEYRAPNTYRFFFRSDVAFSDGTRFDARAAAHTFADAAATRNDYSFLSDSSVKVIDDTTLDIRPARENGIRVRGGRRLALSLIVGFPNPQIHRPMPEIVQSALREIGRETSGRKPADRTMPTPAFSRISCSTLGRDSSRPAMRSCSHPDHHWIDSSMPAARHVRAMMWNATRPTPNACWSTTRTS